MKRLLSFIPFIALTITCFGQNVSETTLNNLLDGKWLNSADSALTVTISGDTIRELIGGTQPEWDIYTYKITTHNSDHREVQKSPTGYYLEEKDTEDGETECGSIQKITPDNITIVFPDDELVLARIK